MAAAPPVLDQLIARFDASAFDAPAAGRGCGWRWTTPATGTSSRSTRSHRLEPADRNARPDARLCADRATWARVARDLRGGMNAFRSGRLQIRDNLHLGVGFLAATSGARRAGAPRDRPGPDRDGQHRRRAGRRTRTPSRS